LRKLGHLLPFVHFIKIFESGRDKRARERVLKREGFGEQEESRTSRDWS